MNSSKWIWRIVSIFSIVATLLLVAGFAYAISDINHPQGAKSDLAAPAKNPGEGKTASTDQKKELKAAAIGDSLAKGTGDNTGGGFVRRSISELSAKTGKKITLLNNLAINGLTTDGLLPKLKEHGTQYVLGQADIILLSIGGNDIFQGADLLAGAPESTSSGNSGKTPKGAGLKPEDLLKALPQASKQLKQILEEIRGINPNAMIIYVGLYNPFGDIEQLKVPGNEAVTAWNNAALSIINKYGNMSLVPTFDLFQHNLNKYLSSDHFHPNGDGYQLIAERIVQGIS